MAPMSMKAAKLGFSRGIFDKRKESVIKPSLGGRRRRKCFGNYPHANGCAASLDKRRSCQYATWTAGATAERLLRSCSSCQQAWRSAACCLLRTIQALRYYS